MISNVLVVYHHLPNYRYSVFSSLQEQQNTSFHFAADDTSRDGTIPTLNHSHVRHFHKLRNSWIGPFLWQHGLIKVLMDRQWDAVIFLGDYSHITTWLGATLMRIRRIPIAYWTIGWHRPESGIRKWVRMTFYSLANRLLLYGHDAQRIGQMMGYPMSRMGVIGNSSGTPDDEAELIDPGQPQRQPQVVGAAIRLNQVKRLDLLIRAVAILRDEGRQVEIALLGTGPEEERLKSLAKELEVPLHIQPPAYDELTLVRFYQNCSATVVPSAAGLTVTQSMRYGRPVITHDDPWEQMPEYDAIRPGATGALYKKGSLKSLARGIESVLDGQHNDWTRYRDACHQEIRERWTGPVQAQAIMRELTALVSTMS